MIPDTADLRHRFRGMIAPRACIVITEGASPGASQWGIAVMEAKTLAAIKTGRVMADRVHIVSTLTPIVDSDTCELDTLAKALGCECIHGLTFFSERYASAGGAA